jgi:20S proteasome subunit alpha 7
VENGGTSIGIKFRDGIVLAVEKIISSKLLVPNSNKRIQTIDKHVGVAYSGLIPDGRHIVNRGRDEASSWRSIYSVPIPIPSLADRLGSYVQAYTLYSSVRPFGITTIMGGVDEDGPHLYMIEPSGASWGYLGAATGKGRQVAKSELEKLDLASLSGREAVKEAAKIIYLAHEDTKDKDFELEMTWVSKSDTNGRHEFVPHELLEEAKLYALEEISGGDEMEE